MAYRKITQCRLCGKPDPASLFSLGMQALTGVFPKMAPEAVEQGPLELVKCGTCHLVQLAHSFAPDMMYGENYGYRSGLNASMVRHLKGKVDAIRAVVDIGPNDLLIDIGSNDSTLLQQYPAGKRVGIDPTGSKFKSYYPAHITLIPDFFSAGIVRERLGNLRAKVVTSIAMFYDLEDPTQFARDIASLLAPDGVWVFEMSYMPSMLQLNSYDTICHEHLEYYALHQIQRVTEAAGLKIVGIEINDVNGGSFSVMASPKEARYPEAKAMVDALLRLEECRGLHTPRPYREFWERTTHHRDQLRGFFADARLQGKTVVGYGASTKGNVLLQFCGIGAQDLACIAEVNQDKFGCFTPGTAIPIVSEAEARAKKPAYYFVLPWHFKAGIVAREREFLAQGGKLVFPLPEFHVVG